MFDPGTKVIYYGKDLNGPYEVPATVHGYYEEHVVLQLDGQHFMEGKFNTIGRDVSVSLFLANPDNVREVKDAGGDEAA